MSDTYAAIQTLQTQIRQTNSALTAATAASSSSSASWQYYDLDGTTLVTDATGVSGSWQIWNIGGVVPTSATHVQLECWSLQDQPDGGTALSFLYVRSNSGGASLVGCAGRSAGTEDATGSAMQGMFPVSSGQIQYNADSNFIHWQIRAVGYWA